MPLPRQLLQIDFDQFHRYAALTVLLKPLLLNWQQRENRPLRLLEVGSHSLNLLPAFLAPIPIEIVRCDIEPSLAGDLGPYVTIQKDAPFPFENDAFDVAVAMEVLEHIPAEDRTFAMGEWVRVASKGVFFSCPNGKRVRKLEGRADADFQARHGRQHPWLEEHERFGWPTRREVAMLCETIGITCHRFYNSPLAEWLPLLLATEQLFETGDQALTKRFNEMLNLRPFRAFIQEPGYRTLYAGFKTEALDQEAHRVWQRREVLAEALETKLDPSRILSRQLCEYVREQRQNEVDQSVLQNAQRCLLEVQQTLQKTEATLQWERWQRQYDSPSNRFKCYSGRPAINPEISYQLKPFGPSHWMVEGNEAVLIWTTSLERGWHQIELVAEVEKDFALCFTVGTDDGFNEDTTIRLSDWSGTAERRVFHFYLHQPVRRLRLQLTQSSGNFVLQRFVMAPVLTWQVAVKGLNKLLKKMVTAPLRTWKISRSYPSLLHYGMALTSPQSDSHLQLLSPYQRWLQQQRPGLAQRQQVMQTLAVTPAKLVYLMQISSEEMLSALPQTLKSLQQQDECCWELYVAIRPELLEKCRQLPALEGLGQRVQWMPWQEGIGQARLMMQCIEESKADWLMLLKPGDTLEVDAGCALLEAACKHSDAALLYADEDTLLSGRGEADPLFKPVIERETLRYQLEVLGDAVALHGPTLLRLGGLNPSYDGALIPEYIHRLMQSESKLVQIKRVLLHKLPRPAVTPSVKLVWERLAEDYAQYTVKSEKHVVTLRQTTTSSSLFEPGLVSIIIPSAGKVVEHAGQSVMHLERCLTSLRKIPTGANVEIIVVDQENLSRQAMSLLKQHEAQRISVAGPFNFSLSINVAARMARGEYLLLLNDDTEVITPRWLEQMMSLMGEGVGAVGAKLLFPNGTIQHLGISLNDGVPIHPHYGQTGRSQQQPRNCLAATAACLMTSREAFDAAHGFDESFELNYNDVDYCLRLRQLGYRLVMNPQVELYHHESQRHDGRAAYRPDELVRFQQRWLSVYRDDPFLRHYVFSGGQGC
jgi:GT2 family glycosyltransferase